MSCSNESSSKTRAPLRFKWRVTVLLVWVVVAGPAILGVWFLVKPTYTASAQIQVLPFLSRVLYRDEENQQMPMFDSYLRTQGEIISSNQVLTAALAQESVKNLPLLGEPDPLSALRGALKVETVTGTQIVQINVTRGTAAEAVALARAVSDSYLLRVDTIEKKDERAKRSVLESEQKRLREAVKTNRDERLKLANEFGTATDSTFDLLQQSISEAGLQTKQKLEAAELEILQIKDQIKQVEQGVYTGLRPDETITREQESIENDPMVRSLRELLLAESAKLARLKYGSRDEAKEDGEISEVIGQLKAGLEKELARAADELQKDRASVQNRMKDSIISRKKLQLAAAESRRDELKKRVAEQEDARKRIGMRGVEIQTLREDFERLKKDLELVEERTKQLDMEGQRPGRISKASDAEIRPDGVNDRRLSLSLVVGAAALLLAVVAAFLRHRMDPHCADGGG